MFNEKALIKKKFSYNKKNIFNFINIYNKNGRKIVSKQKNRSKVAFSNLKPWKQKGTGRARAGSRSSPLWIGGGRAFPNTGKENFKKKINKKFFRYCLKSSLINGIKIKKIFFYYFKKISIGTNNFLNKIKLLLKIKKNKVLFIIGKSDSYYINYLLSLRNIKNFCLLSFTRLSSFHIETYNYIIISINYIGYLKDLC